MMLCRNYGRFLFEAMPDEFPEGRLTPDEMELWIMLDKETEKK